MPRHPPPLNPAENGLLGGSGSTGKVARGSGSATTDWIALPLVWIEALVLLAEATLASAVAAKARDAALALAPSAQHPIEVCALVVETSATSAYLIWRYARFLGVPVVTFARSLGLVAARGDSRAPRSEPRLPLVVGFHVLVFGLWALSDARDVALPAACSSAAADASCSATARTAAHWAASRVSLDTFRTAAGAPVSAAKALRVVAIAPWSEELLYRGLLLHVLRNRLQRPADARLCIALSGMLFGGAHLHAAVGAARAAAADEVASSRDHGGAIFYGLLQARRERRERARARATLTAARARQTGLGALIGASYAARVLVRQLDGSAVRRLGALPEAVACHATNNAIAALLPRSAVRAADIADARFIAPVLATALFYGSLLRADTRTFSAG